MRTPISLLKNYITYLILSSTYRTHASLSVRRSGKVIMYLISVFSSKSN